MIEVIRNYNEEEIKDVFARALAESPNCDGVVILMQKKEGGLKWYAPDRMKLETLVFYLWSALSAFGRM